MKLTIHSRWIYTAAGALLIAAAMSVLGLNERNVQAYRLAAARHGGVVINLGREARPSTADNGHMVLVSGVPRIVKPPRDPYFNVSANALRLVRIVEMFQWHELRMGGDVFYEMDWEDHPVDSSRFVHPAGHRNDVRFPFTSEHFVAPKMQLGAFQLDSRMTASINGDRAVVPNMAELPPNLAASFQLHDGALVTSADPSSPHLGDLRVHWEAVPVQDITVIARAQGDQLVPAEEAADGSGYVVQLGERSLSEMMPDLPSRPHGLWTMRIIALVLSWAGVILLGQGRRRMPVAWMTTLCVAVALTGALTSALWIAADPWTGLLMAGVTVGAMAVAFWLTRGKAA